MPTYSYRCTECGHAFDIQQAFTDDSLTVCPSCGGNLRKLFSAVGVTFNGSGFYRNDSRAAAKSSSKAASSSSSSSSSSPSDSSSSASESKPSTPAPAPTSTASTASD
jgi:putative FmdB family regulatory protein